MAQEVQSVIDSRLVAIGEEARRLAADDVAAGAARSIDELARVAVRDLRRIVPVPEPAAESCLTVAERPVGERLSTEIAGILDLLPPGAVRVCFTGINREPRLPPALRRAAVRVFQEGTTNALKYGTGTVQVNVAFGSQLVLTLTNDVPRRVPEVAGSGAGLINLRERLAELGGRLTVSDADAERFRIRAVLPLRGTRGSDGASAGAASHDRAGCVVPVRRPHW
ncbi:sensor histidine kinase [Cryptosporangium minutisporangium]